MLCCNVQRNLGEVEVRPDTRCCGNMKAICDFIHQMLGERHCVHVLRCQIIGHVEERFVDRIHVNIPWVKVIQIQRVDIRCVFNVQSHAGRGDLVLDIAGDLRQPTAVSYALCLHRWSNRKTQGIFPACEICNDEICLEGIIPTLGTFDRCVKALHVYAEVSSCFCHGGYAPFCYLRCGGEVIALAPPQCWGRRPFR